MDIALDRHAWRVCGAVPVPLPGEGGAGRGGQSPPDEQPAVDVLTGERPEQVRRVREARHTGENRALRPDHPGLSTGHDDEVRPAVDDPDAPVLLPRVGGPQGFLPGRPAQFVEDAGAQGAGQRGCDAGGQGFPQLVGGDGQRLPRQPGQRAQSAGVAGESGQFAGEVPPADLRHPGCEHRPPAWGLGQVDDGLLAVAPFPLGAAAPERRTETRVGLQREEVPTVLAGRPRAQGEPLVIGGFRHRYVEGQKLVEQVHVADRGLEGVPLGPEFGTQCVGHAVGQRIQFRRRGLVSVGPAQCEEPARPSDRAVGGTGLGGQCGVAQPGSRSGVLQQGQPLGQFVPLPLRRQQPQQRAADGGLAPGQFQQGGPVGLPPAWRCLDRAGQRQHLAEVGHLLGERVLARDRLRQPAQVGRARARRRHAVRGEPDEEPAQVPEGRRGRYAGRQPLGVAGEDLRRHRAGQGELEEHRVHACLVER